MIKGLGLQDGRKPASLGAEEMSPSDSEHERSVELASAKLIGHFVMKARGSVNVEKDSVYGAAILVPQLARSAGWPKFLVFLTVRTYMFHVLNIVVQGWLLILVSKEEQIFDLFAGQMYLCDSGAFLSDCPGPGCTGPGGTMISAPRLYPWSQWSTRNYVRDSLKAIFPERAEEIGQKVDPGEYGVESYGCRWLCCFIYMISVMNELYLITRMWLLLYHLPGKAEAWIEHNPDMMQSETNEDEWIDHVKLKVAGMPWVWKLFNIMIVFVPKCLLWKITAEAGITLLMETSSIEDLIVNSVALSFILNLDEMICDTLMSSDVKLMLEMVEDFDLHDDVDSLSEAEILETHGKEQALRNLKIMDIAMLFPTKLLAALALTAVFVYEYYWTHCQWTEEHRFFSIDMHLPRDTSFNWLNAFFPRFAKVDAEAEPFWTMPPVVSG